MKKFRALTKLWKEVPTVQGQRLRNIARLLWHTTFIVPVLDDVAHDRLITCTLNSLTCRGYATSTCHTQEFIARVMPNTQVALFINGDTHIFPSLQVLASDLYNDDINLITGRVALPARGEMV